MACLVAYLRIKDDVVLRCLTQWGLLHSWCRVRWWPWVWHTIQGLVALSCLLSATTPRPSPSWWQDKFIHGHQDVTQMLTATPLLSASYIQTLLMNSLTGWLPISCLIGCGDTCPYQSYLWIRQYPLLRRVWLYATIWICSPNLTRRCPSKPKQMPAAWAWISSPQSGSQVKLHSLYVSWPS